MYWKIRSFVAERFSIVAPVVLVSVLALWTVSQFVPPLGDWITDSGFFSIIIIALLVDALGRLVKPDVPLTTHPNWEEVRSATTQVIREERPREARLLEYSCWQLDWLFSELSRANVDVRVLMKHPATAISEHERRRIEDNIATLRRDYSQFDVRLYALPAGVRGRRIGSHLVVGWYTYDTKEDEICIYGHSNAIVVARANSKEGHPPAEMFDRAFDALWNDSQTVDLSSFDGVGIRQPMPTLTERGD